MNDLSIHGRYVDPITGEHEGWIQVRDGTIQEITTSPQDAHYTIELTNSQILFPAFIDPHVHLREPGWEHKEDFLTGSGAAIHGGVLAVGDMPNLPQPITTLDRLHAKEVAARKSLIDILHIGGVGRESTPEMLSTLASRVPAFKIYTAESTGELTVGSWARIDEAVQHITHLQKPIIFHCEEQEINDHAANELKERTYAGKHCDERPPESEIQSMEQVLAIIQKSSARAHIAHLSTAMGMKLLAEAQLPNLTAEVTPHHLLFTRADMDRRGSFLKVNPPLRTEHDRSAVLTGLKTGIIHMLATDHAPHTLAEKQGAHPPSGMPGLDTYGLVALWLLVREKMTPKQLARATSYHASKLLGLSDRARIAPNFNADFVILDTAGTTTVRNQDMVTRCKWSPLEGMTFPGKISTVIQKGNIIGPEI